MASVESTAAIQVIDACEQALIGLRDLFRKPSPKEGDDRARDRQVKKLLASIQDNLRLLEQKKVLSNGDKLDGLWQLTKAAARDGDDTITHAGSGNIVVNHGGNQTNYLMSGSGGTQVNNPGVYNEGPLNHTHNYRLASDSSQRSFRSANAFAAGPSILQSDSVAGAEKKLDHLCDQIEKLHSENNELSARLANVEQLLESRVLRLSDASVTRGTAPDKLTAAHMRQS